MRKLFLICFASVLSMVANAQILVKSSEQLIIETVVENGFFVAKQSFQIRDPKTDELYGLNGEDEFGIQYSLGIKTMNGYCAFDQFVRPWRYDERFKKYSASYEPVLYQSYFAEQKETAAYDSLQSNLSACKAFSDSTLYLIQSSTFGGKGFVVDSTDGKKDGWVVWVTKPKGQSLEKKTLLNYTIYRKTLELESGKNSFDIESPIMDDEILGGIWVVPDYKGIGVVEFRLCGILLPDKKAWKIVCPFVGMQSAEGNLTTGVEKEDNDDAELTPVENKDKNRDKKKRRRK